MKRSISSVLAAALLAPLSLFAQEAKTDPVGAVTYTINPGFNAVGITMVNAPLISGTISGVSSSSITPVIPSGQTAVDYGALLETGKFYYLEVTDTVPGSQYEGDRFEIDVPATKSGQVGSISINTSSPRTTIPGNIPAEVSSGNPGFSIRPHVTISQVFGVGATAKLTGSNSLSSADSVIFFENGAFSKVVWYFKSGVNDFWRFGSSNFNNEPIPPGVGILVRRASSTPVEITLTGDVRTNHFAQPLQQGWNFVCDSRPTDRSPVQRAMLDTDSQGVWTGSNSLSSADFVSRFASGAFSDIIWYFKSGSNNSWRKGSTLVNNDTTIFSGTSAVLILKKSAAPDYYIPNSSPSL